MAPGNRSSAGQGMGLSLSGYTPVFDSVFKGSLCGKWPDTAAWICLIALADWRGHIDMTPEYIASVTGMPLPDLLGCIDRFMQPDPRSRSQAEDGRKLVLIDPQRPWGWLVVNFALYRERARNINRTARGELAEKQRRYRERQRALPDVTRRTRTQTHTQTQTQTEEERAPAREPPPAGLNAEAWNRWEAYRREIRKPIKPASVQAAQRKLTGFGADQAAVVEQSIAQGWTGLFELKATNGNGHAQPRKTRYEQMQEALQDATES